MPCLSIRIPDVYHPISVLSLNIFVLSDSKYPFMTNRLTTLFSVMLAVTFVLLRSSAQPLPSDSVPFAAPSPSPAVVPSAVADYPTVVRQRVDSLLRLPLLEYSQLGLCVYDLTADSLIVAHGQHQCLRPASCEKVITAAAAIETLGNDFRLSTTLFVDTLDSTLIIKAAFDPFFRADDMHAFVDAVCQAGIKEVRCPIVFDCTVKDTLALGWGWCWDDDNPSLSALLYNGGDTFASHFRSALVEAGIFHPDSAFSVRYAPTPSSVRPLVVRSHTLQQVLQPMLKRSDNLMAEVLFYHLAAHSGKTYAGRREATDAIKAFIHRASPHAQHFQIADGSGLSLYNYTTPAILVDVLRHAWNDTNLYEALFPALPVMGKDGTLRRRCHGQSAQHRVWAKTGTVEGVSTLAGYAMAPNGHRLAFAIMNQGIRRTRDGQHFQDLLCNALTEPLRRTDIEPDSISALPLPDSTKVPQE